MSRDNARTPMQWDDGEHAGFTTGTPWLAVNPNYVEVNAKAALADPDSVLHHYRRLIELRHTEPAVAHGDFTMILADHDRVYAFCRRLDHVELFVVGNFSAETAEVAEVAAWADAEVLLGNWPLPQKRDAHVTLQPWEARVYRRGR
jgi:oligo-1,6-glucosidase